MKTDEVQFLEKIDLIFRGIQPCPNLVFPTQIDDQIEQECGFPTAGVARTHDELARVNLQDLVEFFPAR